MKFTLKNYNCSFCNNNMAKTLLTKQGFSIVKCSTCSFVYVNPRVENEELSSIYEHNYFKNKDYGYVGYEQEKRLRIKNFERWLKDADKYITIATPVFSLDVGCAAGYCLELMKKKGWNAMGIELDEEMCKSLKQTGYNISNSHIEDFESEDKSFDNRARLQVYLNNAKSFLKGKRFFIDHSLRINSKDVENNIFIKHQFNYEHKFFEYNQATIASTIGTGSSAITLNRFGPSIVSSNINDQVRYSKLYNKISAVYENKSLGEFEFFIENFNYHYYYNIQKTINNPEDLTITTYPTFLQNTINSIGGQYKYNKNNWKGTVLYSNSISVIPLRNFDAKVNYKFNDKNQEIIQVLKANR